jgi:replicative DNA helicase
LQRRPFFIDDSPGLTLENIVLKIRKSAQAGGKRLIIIDHLHKIKTSIQNAVRMNELEHITNVLVELGNELELPILVLAQLSRAS